MRPHGRLFAETTDGEKAPAHRRPRPRQQGRIVESVYVQKEHVRTINNIVRQQQQQPQPQQPSGRRRRRQRRWRIIFVKQRDARSNHTFGQHMRKNNMSEICVCSL